MAARLPTLRVLVVDDCPDTVWSLAALLGIWGYEVGTARSGAEALRSFGEFSPDVVLLDIGMPGMDGLEVTRRLRQSPSGRRAVIVGLTGYADDRHRRLAEQAGCDHYWIKPVEPCFLHRLLEEIDERRV
jgi:CheY-like chemotaxis protein